MANRTWWIIGEDVSGHACYSEGPFTHRSRADAECYRLKHGLKPVRAAQGKAQPSHFAVWTSDELKAVRIQPNKIRQARTNPEIDPVSLQVLAHGTALYALNSLSLAERLLSSSQASKSEVKWLLSTVLTQAEVLADVAPNEAGQDWKSIVVLIKEKMRRL